MPEVILRGKAGVPQTKQEGNTIVVKKDIANAVLEERHPTRRLKGKQAQLPVFSQAEVDSKVEAAKQKTAAGMNTLANQMGANLQKKFEDKIEKEKAGRAKAEDELADKARFMKGKVVAAQKAKATAQKATVAAQKAKATAEKTTATTKAAARVVVKKALGLSATEREARTVAIQKERKPMTEEARERMRAMNAEMQNPKGNATTETLKAEYARRAKIVPKKGYPVPAMK
jgi:hypothetical protein